MGVRFAKMFLIIDLGTFLTMFDFGDSRTFPETASPFPAFPGNGFGYYT